ncbi:MAG: site-2 protease family protein [Caldisphaera sp.]
MNRISTFDEQKVNDIISKYFDVTLISKNNNSYQFKILGLKDGDKVSSAFVKLYKESFKISFNVALRKENNELMLYMVKKESRIKKSVVIGLAIATLITVYISGLDFKTINTGFAWSPFAYLIGLIIPLLIHEAGHWITMRRYNVPASPPYLLPAPPLQFGFLGTFGAVINMEWVPPTNDILALTGVMGPLFGFLAAIPFAFIGLKYSTLMPYSPVSSSTISLVPLILSIITYVEKIPQGYIIQPSAMMFASYIVFFITFLNLIPVSQLDGGHVLRAALGERGHYVASQIFIVALILAGIWYSTFALFGIFVLFIFLITRGKHPGAAMESNKISYKGLSAVIIYCLLLILTLPLPS